MGTMERNVSVPRILLDSVSCCHRAFDNIVLNASVHVFENMEEIKTLNKLKIK